MTETIAFGLRLRPGSEAEYQRRHDEIWPEMRDGLLGAGRYSCCMIPFHLVAANWDGKPTEAYNSFPAREQQ